MLNAKPNINGNTRRDFADAYKALLTAQDAIKAARGVVMDNVVNGRNYQHLAGQWDAEPISRLVSDDARRARESFGIALTLLEALAGDIVDACGSSAKEAA